MENCFKRHIGESHVLTLSLHFIYRPQSFHMSTNYKVIKAPSDGHCMMHAWSIALKNSREIQDKREYIHLPILIYREFTENINLYKSFVSDTTDIYEEVLKYLQDGNYASEVGDLVFQALANITEISAMIYTEDVEGSPVQYSLVKPISGQSKGLINLLKIDQHYDVIVFGRIGETT